MCLGIESFPSQPTGGILTFYSETVSKETGSTSLRPPSPRPPDYPQSPGEQVEEGLESTQRTLDQC